MSKCRYDLSEDCHNKDCLNYVLDKIIAEIMQYMFLNGFGSEYQDDIRKIIEKHISGKEN